VSAAAGLSLSLALAELYDLPHRVAHEVAHTAEVESRTGLGDVAGQIAGGFEARVRPGLPPRGRIVRLPISGPVVLASLGPKLATRGVLGDPRARRRVNAAGACSLRRFLARPDARRFAEVSARFAQDAGLAHRPTLALAGLLSGHCPAGQVMLGRTLFALPDEDGMRRAVRLIPTRLPRWRTRISDRPAGVLT
jgi:pantoate kinase